MVEGGLDKLEKIQNAPQSIIDCGAFLGFSVY
jgi:hypothetical protein